MIHFFEKTIHVFDRNYIHIQALVDFINGNLMSGHSSSSTFHDFQEFTIFDYQKTGILNFKNSKSGHLRFPELRNSQNFQFSDFHR